MKNIKCQLGFHKPEPEAVYGYMGPAGLPDYDTEFAYIAQKCSRCGKILTVCWPPKDEVIRRITW